LGKIHLPFAGEQRRGTHLAQVNAHRVVVHLWCAWRWAKVDVLCYLLKPLIQSCIGQQSLAFNHVKALGANGAEQIVYVLLGIYLVWISVVHLVVPGYLPNRRFTWKKRGCRLERHSRGKEINTKRS